MHASLMSWVASMDADSFVRSSKETPQGAANLHADGASSPANMAQVVLAVENLSQGGLWLPLRGRPQPWPIEI